jgi:hypothetical protein
MERQMFENLKTRAQYFTQEHPVATNALKGVWTVTVVASTTAVCYAVAENINKRRTPEE